MQEILDQLKQACMDYGRNQFTNTLVAHKLLNEIAVLEQELNDVIDAEKEEYGHLVRETFYEHN